MRQDFKMAIQNVFSAVGFGVDFVVKIAHIPLFLPPVYLAGISCSPYIYNNIGMYGTKEIPNLFE
jgi:hypothetical protein